MLSVFFNTISPLFVIILFGYFLKKRNIITQEWESISNKIVYNIAVPAILIKALSKSDVTQVFSYKIIFSIFLPILATIFVAFIIASYFFKLENSFKATFIHSSIHGNIGYMAYAVGYYAMNESIFHNLVIISSFLIIFQNIMAVVILTIFTKSLNLKKMINLIVTSIIKNPIIIAVFIGCTLSLLKINLPKSIERLILILSNMGLPTALLLIGAGLIFNDLKKLLDKLIVISILKLFFMPLSGYVFANYFNMNITFLLPLMILLSSPSAVVSYVLATQIGGSPKLASANVSLQTLLCAISYSIILGFFKI